MSSSQPLGEKIIGLAENKQKLDVSSKGPSSKVSSHFVNFSKISFGPSPVGLLVVLPLHLTKI
jgi:hypothetical protein